MIKVRTRGGIADWIGGPIGPPFHVVNPHAGATEMEMDAVVTDGRSLPPADPGYLHCGGDQSTRD